MSQWSDFVGTVKGYIRLGLTGVRLKNSSGTLSVRNAGDTADAPINTSAITGLTTPLSVAQGGTGATTLTASGISNTPAGNIAATTVQAAINELDTEKAGLALANTFTQPQTITAGGTSATLTITQTGTGHALVVNDQAGDTTNFVVGENGSIGIGGAPNTATTLVVELPVTGAINAYGCLLGGAVQSDVTTSASLVIGNVQTSGAAFTLGSARAFSAQQGSSFGSTTVTNQIGYLVDGSMVGATNNYGVYSAIAAATGRWNFYAGGTAQNYFAGETLHASLFGYTTGAGGTVTQATSRTTGVTLSKPTGAITLVSAAGVPTSVTSFTVTNTLVAATDAIIVNQVSGTDLYEIHITAVAAGSFRITFKTTGGTTTEQPVFRFAIIKGISA